MAVFFFQGHPGKGQIGNCDRERSQQGRLAVAGRGGEQCERVLADRRVERVQQALACDEMVMFAAKDAELDGPPPLPPILWHYQSGRIRKTSLPDLAMGAQEPTAAEQRVAADVALQYG